MRIVVVALVVSALVMNPASAEAQGCGTCVDYHAWHHFTHEPAWEYDGQHFSYQVGSCSGTHQPCFNQEDVLLLSTPDHGAKLTRVAALVREGRAVVAYERGMLLLRGCHNDFVAAFPLTAAMAALSAPFESRNEGDPPSIGPFKGFVWVPSG